MTIQERENNNSMQKLLIAGSGVLLLAMAAPSAFLLTKVAIGSAIASIIAISAKIASKAVVNILGQNNNGEANKQINKASSIAVGMVAILIGGASLITVAEMGLIASCTAVVALSLQLFMQNKYVSEKLEEVSDRVMQFSVTGIEKIFHKVQQSTQAK